MEAVKRLFKDSIKAKKDFLSDEECMDRLGEAASELIECYKRGGKAMIFGNGGSAADSQHMAAELVVRFEKERKSLPCIALSTNTSTLTAASNDYSFEKTFSRQVEGLAHKDDIAIAISTSGNSSNVIEGARAARAKGARVIALTGRDGGELAELADVPVVVKCENTARIQEVHITIIHALCKMVEEAVS